VSRGGWGAAARFGGAIILAMAWAAAPSPAHSPSVGDVIAAVRGAERLEPVGIVSVERSPDLARMLVIRVDDRWSQAPAERRRAAAERWLESWRHVVRDGIVAVVDAESLETRVSYDVEGRAQIKPGP